jgi:glycosyltransferase involved in cell wall biosynthesis
MRVLFVNENLGGHATVHLNLERALQDHPEIDATFLHVPPPSFVRRLVGASVPGLGRLDLDLQPLRAQLALSAFVRRRLRRVVADFDALHVYTHNAALLSGSLLESKPTVVSLDSTNALNAYRLAHRAPTRWTPRVLPLTQRFERRVYDAATLIVANSSWVATSLRSTYSVAPEKIRVLPFGVPVPRSLPPAPTSEGLPQITFVGRQLERKGGRRLIELHQRFLAARCVLNLVTTEPVPDLPNVRVYGDLTPGDPRLTDVLRASRAFVFPSAIDQAPNAVLEAMAMGVAVVALRVSALPEMVDDGRSGILVEPGDDGGLVAAIETLLDDPATAAVMGVRGHERALARYEIGATTTELVRVLSEAVDRWRAPGPP